MEAKRSKMSEHASGIAQVLASLCGVKLISPLVGPYEYAASGEIVITIVAGVPNPSLPQRKVTTDLGRTETVLGLPIPDSNQPKFWIGLNESWVFLSKHKVGFRDCGIRVYMGSTDEDSSQFLRLEWVAPDVAKDGTEVYQGAHAGHPHWHIDRAALVGPEERFRSLELLTAPIVQEAPVEFFSGGATRPETPRLVQDLSWLGGVHLPVQAEWMHHNWNGQVLPAPHQSAPKALEMLTSWWEGSLRYVFAELSQHSNV
jgi:hypothetical protein